MTNLWQDDSPLLELRTYTLHPGRREALIELFERELLDPQEALGLRVLGQFRAPDEPNHFIWVRGYAEASERGELLQRFYSGPTWQAHRDAANATMIDSDDVLLLRPAAPGSGVRLTAHRDSPGTPAARSVWAATTLLHQGPVDAARLATFAQQVTPLLGETGARLVGCYLTDPRPNDYPRHPVREGLHALVWFTSFVDEAAYRAHWAAFSRDERWRAFSGERPLRQQLLSPTARSRLGHHPSLEHDPMNRAFAAVLLASCATTGATLPTGEVHDFDFLLGEWTVANRRLAHRGVGSTEWVEFPGVSRLRPYLSGLANVDQLDFSTLGFSGMTVRLFNRETRRWSIWWISSRTGQLSPPVEGGFVGDRGEFYGVDDDDGRRVRVRFVWTRLGPTTARWEQAFDYGDGRWETNWVMEFSRRG